MISIACIFIILLCGAIGGLINALLTDNGFVMPKTEICNAGKVKIIRPGVLGNCLISAVAAFISWALYIAPAELTVTQLSFDHLKLGPMGGALLVGVAGARWLTAAIDKKLLRAAASDAAMQDGRTELSSKLAMASPADAWTMVKEDNALHVA